MVNLINFKELFNSWSYTKTEEESLFKKQLSKLNYEDGCLFWEDSTDIDTDVLYAPKLNGNEEITSWTSISSKIENGIFYSHGSFLTDGWSNEGLWQLDFDCMCTDWWYIGLMPICSEEIVPFTDEKNNNYSLTVWEGFGYPSGLNNSIVNQDDYTKNSTPNLWHHMTIQKLSETEIKIILDKSYVSIRNVPNLANLSTLHIGSRDNPANRNSGGFIQLKNINVIQI